MKKNLFLLVAIIFSVAAIAQKHEKTNFSGRVVDTGFVGIPGAYVRLLNSNIHAVTDKNGVFTFVNIFPGSYVLDASATGFVTETKQVHTVKDTIACDITLYTSAAVLEKVVVTAQKSDEVLQNIPLSITAFTQKQVEQYGLWNIKDISAIVPNFYSADPGDQRNVSGIRGITSTSYDPAIATYIDGVNQFNLDTYISQLFDVDRIEVLRGPQGTLYGRNAMGGVINIITKQPTNKTETFGEISFGNNGLQRYSAAVRSVILKDKMYFGIAALYENSSGFYTNELYNSPFDKKRSITTNYYGKYLPSNRWSFTLNVKSNINRNNGAFPLVFGDDALSDPFKLSQNAVTALHDKILNTSLSVNYTGKEFNFSSHSSWQANYRYYKDPIDADFSPIDGITIINNYGRQWNNVKVLLQEFRISSPAAIKSKLKWAGGAQLFSQDSPAKQATRFGDDAVMVGSPDVNYSLINTTKAKSKGGAIFAQGTYAISKKFDLTAGIRYDTEKKDQSVLGEYQKDPDPMPLFAYRPDTSGHANFYAFSPKFTIAYKISRENLLFINYSRGFRAGGLTPLSADPSQPALHAYKPEYSNNYEAAIKNTFWKNRLQLNITAFYTTVMDAQVPTLVLPDAFTITKNTGRLTSKGLEVETISQFNKLRLDYNFGYTEASYANLKIASNGAEVDLAGKNQIFTPNITSMLAAQLSLTLSKRKQLTLNLRGEWKYFGRQYFDLANTIKQGDYSLLNARAELGYKGIALILWARNLTDKTYISYAYDFGAIHLGNPGTYGMTAKVSL